MLRCALLLACVVVLAPVTPVCGSTLDETLDAIDAALARAARIFIQRQDDDGAWRSSTYGLFRDGPTLTPTVATTLFFLTQGGPEAAASYARAADYLAAMVDADGAIAPPTGPLADPVYTAAQASWVVVLDRTTDDRQRAHAAWLRELRRWQCSDELGWRAEDEPYGGWGYNARIPRRPTQQDTVGIDANLSATLFALGALQYARVGRDDQAVQAARVFVERCQNYSDGPADADARYDDGGFYFTPVDPARNKAGVAGTERTGRMRFHSYGSATADGIRALLACGLPPDHPRVAAARRWLIERLSVTRNPGEFPADRAVLRDAYYHYYCWSLAHALHRLGETEVKLADDGRRGHWALLLAAALLERQGDDGTWRNRFTDGREDDPLIATALAGAALVICQRALETPDDESY